MPIANGEAAGALFREAIRKNLQLTQTAIAEKTGELPTPYGETSTKVLHTTRSAGTVERPHLETTLAKSAVKGRHTPAMGSPNQETTMTGDGAIGGSVAPRETFQVAVGAPLKKIDDV